MFKLRTALATAAALTVMATSGLTFAQGWNGSPTGGMGGVGGWMGGFSAGRSGAGYAHDFEGRGSAGGHRWNGRQGHGQGAQAAGGSVTGTVASVSGSQSITLSEPNQETATLPLAANVTVREAGQSSVSLADVTAGESVVLRLDANAEVTSIFVLPATTPTVPPATSTVAAVTLAPNPLAATGSLTAGQSVTVAVYADDANGQPVPGGSVYLSFTAAPGGGTASVDGSALSTTPTAFTAAADGSVAVTYTAPSTLPSAGTDVLTADNASTSPSATATDSYSFGAAATQSVSGSVAAIGTSSITLAAGGQDTSYPLAANVSVVGANGQASSLSALGVGQNVTLTLSQGSVTVIATAAD